LPDWEKSEQYKKVSFRTIEPGRWAQLRDEPGIWPNDIRWIREAFLKDWRKWTAKDQATAGWTPAYGESALTASPRFFVAQDDKLLETAPTKYGWDQYIGPLLSKMLGP
jgi:hypothetical protein